MKIHGDLMSVEDIALVCVAVALMGVWMLGGAWWPLGMMLALVGWGGAVAGLVIDWKRKRQMTEIRVKTRDAALARTDITYDSAEVISVDGEQ